MAIIVAYGGERVYMQLSQSCVGPSSLMNNTFFNSQTNHIVIVVSIIDERFTRYPYSGKSVQDLLKKNQYFRMK